MGSLERNSTSKNLLIYMQQKCLIGFEKMSNLMVMHHHLTNISLMIKPRCSIRFSRCFDINFHQIDYFEFLERKMRTFDTFGWFLKRWFLYLPLVSWSCLKILVSIMIEHGVWGSKTDFSAQTGKQPRLIIKGLSRTTKLYQNGWFYLSGVTFLPKSQKLGS